MAEESIFQKIAGLVGTYAPGVATVLAASGVGAPAAAAVAALGSVAKAFGLPEDTKAEDVLTTVQSQPDSEAKLKIMQAENDFQLKCRDFDIQELKATLTDVQSARQRQTDHEKTTGKSEINLYILAWTIIGGFFFLTGGLLYFSYNGKTIEDGTGVLFMLLGTLSTSFGCVIQYFYGSSKGSADKSVLLSQAVKK
jgi:hypothetical protein